MRQVLSSKRVVTEISTLLRGSKSWQRGRSYAAASVPSPAPKDKKPPTRLSKSDRKVLVKEFIDRYKAANSGKFPGIKAAQKEVGGSYYVIRQMVQEIEYESKYSSINTTKIPSGEEKTKEHMPVTEVEEVLVKEGTMSMESETSKTTLSDEKAEEDMHVTEVEVLVKGGTTSVDAKTITFDNAESINNQMQKLTPASGENPSSTEIVKENKLGNEEDGVLVKKEMITIEAEKVNDDNTESQQIQMPKVTAFKVVEDSSTHSGTEENLKDSGDKFQEFDDKRKPTEDVDIHQTTPKIDSDEHQQKPKSERTDTSVKAENEENQKKSSMWGSIKSMASGFISILKKL